MGRPRGTDGRDMGISIRLTEEELDIFKEVANAHHMPIAKYIRIAMANEYKCLLEQRLDERNFRGIL